MSRVSGKADRDSNADDVLHDFAAEPHHDRATLEDYLRRYPEHADALLDLSHELRLQSRPENLPIDDPDEAWLDDAWKRFAAAAGLSSSPSALSSTDPFARLTPGQFRTLRQALGVPTGVLLAFRDRLVLISTVPPGFLRRLADVLETNVDNLRAFLQEPPRLAGQVSYKSDAAPAASAEKLSFEELLDDAKVPGERRRALLDDQD